MKSAGDFKILKLIEMREARLTKLLPQTTRSIQIEIGVVLDVAKVTSDNELKMRSGRLVDRFGNLDDVHDAADFSGNLLKNFILGANNPKNILAGGLNL